jgi:hypothetical protein
MEIQGKKCCVCKQDLPASAFSKRPPNKRGKVYLKAECKKCHSQLNRFENLTPKQRERRREVSRNAQAEQRKLAALARQAIQQGLIKESASP